MFSTSDSDEPNPASMVMESMDVYVLRQSPAVTLAWRALGGYHFSANIPKSAFDFYDAGKKGIPKEAVIALAESLDVNLSQMADLLNISYKTLARKEKGESMDSWVSSHSIEIANTIARGMSVFGTGEKFRRWLHKENKALRFQKPLDLLKYPTGIRLVNQVLGRIEEGVYS